MHQLKESIIVKYTGELCLIYYGTSLFEIEDKTGYYFNVLSKREWDLHDLNSDIKDFLIKNNLITIKYEISNIDPKLEKNIYYFENRVNTTVNPVDLQKSIKEKKVIILGCGGIGTVVLKNMISLGISDFLIIDFDKVESSNLNRQLFFDTSHVGRVKNDVLKEVIEQYDENITIRTAVMKIQNTEELSSVCEGYNADFFVNCADFPKNIFEIVINYCGEKGIPCISGAVGIETGFWGPIINQDYEKNGENVKVELETIKGSISATNMVIGALISNDIIEFWINPTQQKIYKKKVLNFNDYSIQVVK